jgi:hypothetical protein
MLNQNDTIQIGHIFLVLSLFLTLFEKVFHKYAMGERFQKK